MTVGGGWRGSDAMLTAGSARERGRRGAAWQSASLPGARRKRRTLHTAGSHPSVHARRAVNAEPAHASLAVVAGVSGPAKAPLTSSPRLRRRDACCVTLVTRTSPNSAPQARAAERGDSVPRAPRRGGRRLRRRAAASLPRSGDRRRPGWPAAGPRMSHRLGGLLGPRRVARRDHRVQGLVQICHRARGSRSRERGRLRTRSHTPRVTRLSGVPVLPRTGVLDPFKSRSRPARQRAGQSRR